MRLVPISIDADKSKEMYDNPDCREIFKSYPDYYYKMGYHPPWIGYFLMRNEKVVGVCGFIGQPKNCRAEIAYGTFKEYEGQGIASFSCRILINIAKSADPKIIITAKTAPEHNPSTRILKRNGFEFTGIVQDEDIGDAWEWIYREKHS
jgi:RimJ/RimL family protein N-acetyltransferase